MRKLADFTAAKLRSDFPMTPTLRIMLLALAALGLPRVADAATVTLQWDSNRERDIAGYLVSYGTRSGQLTNGGRRQPYVVSVHDLETGRTVLLRHPGVQHGGTDQRIISGGERDDRTIRLASRIS